MNRTIKFRGKCKSDGQWLYGYYLVNRGLHYIVQDGIQSPFATPEDFEIDPDTLGQFTGASDIQGNEIYEGDIIEVPTDKECSRELVSFNKRVSAFMLSNGKVKGFTSFLDEAWVKIFKFRVVGNIYDNPKLIVKGVPATPLE